MYIVYVCRLRFSVSMCVGCMSINHMITRQNTIQYNNRYVNCLCLDMVCVACMCLTYMATRYNTPLYLLIVPGVTT